MTPEQILAELLANSCWNPARDNPDPPNTQRDGWRKISIELCCVAYELEARLRGDVWEFGRLIQI